MLLPAYNQRLDTSLSLSLGAPDKSRLFLPKSRAKETASGTIFSRREEEFVGDFAAETDPRPSVDPATRER